ncbi:glycosyltransferase family 29 protein [Acinetobacter higginsii]|uniref:glycosyltransferase family 29 protein n=1 Tax=Acinetobacter higginsii TaxID=70347 RepID=UPI001F4B799F|nr:glycosyltransferase family 29 protein [Acinetobacter higginsii]MCH7339009.1 glycosyltransferase family 29 protein [Acinetobacter higginsii]
MVFSAIRKIKKNLKLLQAMLFSYKILKPFDKGWFKGKRVVIIGGADSVLHEKLGEYIDGFDVVVRVNKGVDIIEQQHEFVGQRTDVLFHAFYVRDNDATSSPITIDLWKKHSVDKLIFAHNYACSDYSLFNFLYFLKVSKRKFKFSQLPKQLLDKSHKAVFPAGPTTGFTAINTIFNCKPKELYITGFTFSKTPNNKLYRDITLENLNEIWGVSKAHDVEREYVYIKNIYNKNRGVVKVDAVLENIFIKES